MVGILKGRFLLYYYAGKADVSFQFRRPMFCRQALTMKHIHIVPTFDNMIAFNLVLDRMQEIGMYLMYDMRFTTPP